jgi:hypothetical protein
MHITIATTRRTDTDDLAGIESVAADAENVTGTNEATALEHDDTMIVATDKNDLASGNGL